MSFKPVQNQLYYLIPKGKAGSVIGAPNTNIPVHIEVQAHDKGKESQRFRFEPAGQKASWLLLPPFKERFVAIHDSSLDDRVNAIQWEWEPHKLNLQFQFLPAGNGYYRIIALHSRKFLEILDLSSREKGRLVQNSFNKNDGQLFSITPVPNVPSDIPPIAFDQKSDIIRTGALAVLGKIPEVGAGLSFVVSLFWKAYDPLADLWKQMQTYIDVRVRTLIMENKLNEMGMQLKGIVNSVEEISRADENKGIRVQGKVDSIVEIETAYMETAKQALPYLVALGNIQLSLRRTLYTDYDTLFPPKPRNPNEGKQLLKSKKQNYDELIKAIKLYTTAFDAAVEALVKDRLDKIHWRTETKPLEPLKPRLYDVQGVRVYDDFDGWSIVFWDFDIMLNNGFRNYKEWADFAYNQRKLQIEAQYRSEMTDLGKSALLWGYFGQTTALPAPITYRVQTGVFGGLNSYNPFNGVDNSVITAIEVYSENGNLCGLEVYYNGTGNGLQGKKGNKTDRLDLSKGTQPEDDEFITSVYGYYSDHIYGLWFVSSNGKIVGAGKEDGSYFNADIADGLKARLEKISGKNDVHTLQQLSFHWMYSELPKPTVTV